MHPKTDEKWLRAECAKTTSFEELATIGLAELKKFSGEIEIVCGPITTGGLGKVERNLEVFQAIIFRMLRRGRPLFNQMPYEKQIFLLRSEWKETESQKKPSTYEPVLEEFYRHLFEARRITRAWFIPGWESSNGACWERRLLSSLDVEIVNISKEWTTRAILGRS
jgi:hypothetical protein